MFALRNAKAMPSISLIIIITHIRRTGHTIVPVHKAQHILHPIRYNLFIIFEIFLSHCIHKSIRLHTIQLELTTFDVNGSSVSHYSFRVDWHLFEAFGKECDNENSKFCRIVNWPKRRYNERMNEWQSNMYSVFMDCMSCAHTRMDNDERRKCWCWMMGLGLLLLSFLLEFAFVLRERNRDVSVVRILYTTDNRRIMQLHDWSCHWMIKHVQRSYPFPS